MGEKGAEERAGVFARPEKDEVKWGAGGGERAEDNSGRGGRGERRRVGADAETGGDEPDERGEIAGGVVDGGAGAVFAAGAQKNLAVVGIGLGADEEDGRAIEEFPRDAAACRPRVSGGEREELRVALDEVVVEAGIGAERAAEGGVEFAGLRRRWRVAPFSWRTVRRARGKAAWKRARVAATAGAAAGARDLEPLALLWIRAAMGGERSADFTWARLTR